MSFRSASRLSRSIRPTLPLATRTPVVARRAASSHGGGPGGNDMQWALGSAVVFIPLVSCPRLMLRFERERNPCSRMAMMGQ